jgi:hypothetical protein
MVNPYQNNFYNPQAAYQPQFFGQYMQQPRFQQPAQPEQPVQQQMVQQQPFQRGINGMMVASADNITADCVPMDGSAAFFPKHDLSEIYVKNWCADGTIRTLTFKPISEPQTGNLSKSEPESNLGLSDAITGLFESKFNELSEKIDRLEQSMTKPMAKSRSSMTKKDGEAE